MKSTPTPPRLGWIPFEGRHTGLTVFAPDEPVPTPPPAPVPPTPPAPPAPVPPAPTPDAAALQKAIDDAKAAGNTEATTALLAALGFDKAEDAQAWVTAKRDADKAAMTEVERREADAIARETAAVAREAEAARIIRDGKITGALIAAGAPADKAPGLLGLIAVPADADAAAITAAVEARKTEFPALFTAQGTPPVPPAPPGRVPPPPAPPAPATALDAGRERAKAVAAARAGATKEDLLAAFAPKPSPFAQTG